MTNQPAGEAFQGRREDARLLTGRGRYTSDWDMPGQMHAAFRRAEIAHGRIESIDLEAARALIPGVSTAHPLTGLADHYVDADVLAGLERATLERLKQLHARHHPRG